ncbi:MAG: [FeFe] hydrogenase H-cluster radical SAM maturase HydG, partial [Fervidobacterium sp.]
TISFPRIEPAVGSDITENPPYKVSDEEFKKLVAIIRLAVPYTGMILTAREPAELRREVLKMGISQIDGGSSIGIGSYSQDDPEKIKKSQFVLGDNRSLEEIIQDLIKEGYIPSFCTACYRAGRTGEHFMEFAIPGFVKRFCTPNALFTLREYLNDYASEETREMGNKLITEELQRVDNADKVTEFLGRIDNGERDVRF